MANAVYGVIGALRMVIAYILSLSQIITPAIFGTDLSAYYTRWSSADSFSVSGDTVVFEKQPGDDFTVINLSDIQLTEIEASMDNYTQLVIRTIDKLVKDNDPDLITLSGDNAWGSTSYLWLIETLDSYGIPWAPVMGNHDGQNCPSEDWCAYNLIKSSENCVFKLGPEGMGHGNYIISITENGALIHTLYMLDTHGDGLMPEQVNWYEWAVKGAKAEAGALTESTVIMHIPTEEYELAWNELCGAEATESEYGARHERICWEEDNGFFDKAVELGGTKNILVGHDHVNDFRLTYSGIGLNYSLHCGAGCYWEERFNGGTVITIGSDGHAVITQDYVDPTSLGVWYDAN